MRIAFSDLVPVLRQFDGPLTAELVRQPAAYGLGQVPAQLAPDATTTIVCGFCSTGCGLKVHLKEGVAVNLSPEVNYPVNLGMACPKGWEALAPLAAQDRATMPLLRDSSGKNQVIGWEDATKHFTQRMRSILNAHGPGGAAILSTGQIVTEEMCFLGALARLGMGIGHLDSNTRQCMATAHVAYKQSFGFDAPPYTYADFEESDVLVFLGANPCIAHPILWQRVLRNRRGAEIHVIDPRKTETAMAATHHHALRPKSDLVLLYGIARQIIEDGRIDRTYVDTHTTGFEAFAAFVQPFTLDHVARETGLSCAAIRLLAKAVGAGEKRVSWWWTMGINQGHESTRTAQAIINLALMTGQIGKPGTGANSITGQCNAMGSRLFAHATGLPCGRDFSSAADRAEVAQIYGMDSSMVPSTPSLAYDQIIDAIEAGKIRALWVIATNGAHSWIGNDRFRRAMERLEFLVVQDMFTTTDTAKHAHLLLPAAGWGEKQGTFINSERRIGLVHKVTRAPGMALSDFQIFRLLAHAWGLGDRFREWSSPEAVFRIMQRLSIGRACDISGIRGYAHLAEEGGIQWPFVKGDALGKERRLFADGRFYTADGRARFYFDLPRPVAEPTCKEYPFILLSGRGTSAQWHTGTRTGKSAILRKLHPAEAYVEIHPADAAERKINPGDAVVLSTRRGSITLRARLTATLRRGDLFVPMHYDGVNALTCPNFDPHSRQPSYKHCAARVTLCQTAC